jgi:hypothetical protein
LVCGKHLQDDGYVLHLLLPNRIITSSRSSRAYCGDECEGVDITSPSLSSASSAFSSPHMEFALGGDVPALVPSALGSALSSCQARDRYFLSSSSTSSSWSVTDDEDDAAVLRAEDGYGSDAHSMQEGGSKSLNYLLPSGLSYARRPSGTNTRATVPLLHRRTSSGSSSSRAPQDASAPSIHSSSDDDDDAVSGVSFSREDFDKTHGPSSWANEKVTVTATKQKRSRNRASLPAYFSLLQMNPSNPRSSPLSSSSGHTAIRDSPPTPKIGLSDLTSRLSLQAGGPQTAIEVTPRGRRRVPGTSRGGGDSHSKSRSRSRNNIPHSPPQVSNLLRPRHDSKCSVEQVFDWSSESVNRGRPHLRRNSSPPPKMLIANVGLESGSVGRRGRTRVEELEGLKQMPEAPGYGNGRSGLKSRERDGLFGSRGAIGLQR